MSINQKKEKKLHTNTYISDYAVDLVIVLASDFNEEIRVCNVILKLDNRFLFFFVFRCANAVHFANDLL